MTGPKKEDRESTNEVRDFSITSRLQLQHQKNIRQEESERSHSYRPNSIAKLCAMFTL